MTRRDELVMTAMERARQCIAEVLPELVDLADGDLDGLILASDRVRTSNLGLPQSSRAVEHIAFALLSAAFSEVNRRTPASNNPGDTN